MNYATRRDVWLASLIFTIAVSFPAAPARGQRSSPHDAGLSTFVKKGCVSCHAIYGRGVANSKPKGGPDLGKREVFGTNLGLAATMWNHFPKMLKRFRKDGRDFPLFTEAEVGDIIYYLSFIRYMGEPGNVRSGRKLLHEKKCTSCHTFGGKGGDIGPDFTQSNDYLSPLTLSAAMWNHGPGMMKLFQDTGIDRPRLNGQDIVDLSVGIRSFMRPNRVPVGSDRPGDPERGKALADQKGCNNCHGGEQGTDAAPSFSDMDLNVSVTQMAGDMWNHGPSMWETMENEKVTFPTLGPQEMGDITAFLYELGLQDPPGNAKQGGELVYDKGCISCHSVNGAGADVGPVFSELGELRSSLDLVSRMWNHAPDMDEAVRERKADWPAFSGKELADIYAFLRSLTPSSAGK